MTFETLYQLDKKGQVREWKIWVIGSTIYTEHGLKNGEKIQTVETIQKGKNIGRKNETTKQEQALKEAQSKWTKKKDKGYSSKIEAGKVNYSAMLANEYKKHQAKLKFPCFVQPKLDGYRCIYDGINDRILSRGGKEYSILYGTELHKELQKFKGVILDGELYIHDKDFAFENYGVLRKKKLVKDDIKKLNHVKYNVYDMISEGTFEERYKFLNKNIKGFKKIDLVETLACENSKCIEKLHTRFLKEGYEGSMLRNKDSLYVGKRTSDLLKYKNFDDHEFEVVGFEHEKDTKGDGLKPVVWECITTEGKTFKVQMKGTREVRDSLYKNGKKYIGKFLTVQFFGYSEENIPRFPKSLREGKSSFRDL